MIDERERLRREIESLDRGIMLSALCVILLALAALVVGVLAS